MVYDVNYQYAWGDGWTPKLDAEVVGKVVREIEEKNGRVTREAFLDASRSEDSPTHALFEWDDSIAAEKYRLHTAQATINHLRIIKVQTEKMELVKAYVNVREKSEGSKANAEYVNIVSALSNDETKNLILTRLRLELHALIERNRHIEELADMLEDEAEKLREERTT